MDYSSLGPFQIWYKKSFFLLRHSNLHIYYFIENENLFNSMSYSIFFFKSHFSTEMHIKRDLKKKIWLIKFCWGGGGDVVNWDAPNLQIVFCKYSYINSCEYIKYGKIILIISRNKICIHFPLEQKTNNLYVVVIMSCLVKILWL